MDKILLGYKNQFQILADMLSAQNRHILITGKSGAGKTTALQHLAKEISSNNEQVYFLDYAQCMTASYTTPKNILQQDAITYTFEQHDSTQDATEVLLRYSEIVANIWNLGDKQQAMITSALLQMNSSRILNPMNPFFSFLNFENGIMRGDIAALAYFLSEQGSNDFKNLANKFLDVSLLLRSFSCADKLVEENTSSNFVVLKYPSVTQKLNSRLTDLFLWSIFMKQVEAEVPLPITIICDEVGLLNWRSAGILQKLLNEGRKFNINLILATQSIADKLPKSAINAVKQADLHLAFAPPDTDYTLIAKSLYNKATRDTISTLLDLPTGSCIVRGHLCSDKTPTFEQTLKIHIPYEEGL